MYLRDLDIIHMRMYIVVERTGLASGEIAMIVIIVIVVIAIAIIITICIVRKYCRKKYTVRATCVARCCFSELSRLKGVWLFTHIRVLTDVFR